MEGFDVLLSTSSIRKGNVCYDNTQNGKISDLGKIDTSCHGKAKNVFIRHKKRPSYLNICEIEVYGKFIFNLFFKIKCNCMKIIIKLKF